jgi:nucleotide-binding universal stress UspA family protein
MTVSLPRESPETTAGTDRTQPAPLAVLVVGFDDSPSARRALDQAVNLLSDRPGTIEVVFVEHVPVGAGLAREGFPKVEEALNEQTKALAGQVRDKLLREHHLWHFQGRSGGVAEELIATSHELHDRYGDSAWIAIVVGGSSHRHHYWGGSVAASLIRTNRFPIVVIP